MRLPFEARLGALWSDPLGAPGGLAVGASIRDEKMILACPRARGYAGKRCFASSYLGRIAEDCRSTCIWGGSSRTRRGSGQMFEHEVLRRWSGPLREQRLTCAHPFGTVSGMCLRANKFAKSGPTSSMCRAFARARCHPRHMEFLHFSHRPWA